ncbi:helix-turn-helix transcriptional regulator [Nitratireductor sp. XY-223]|uniref:helix-turn-helix domain-containing protein n=1 Tax=Hyphomicrobiales TaxID=356 RepID=UPI001FEFEF28|nr:helix-turn-helix transcriptional regulator [Nitratireductor sp. XY-223]
MDSRKKGGFTQEQVATTLRKPQSFVAKYERGERRLDVVEFVDICRAISINPANILKKL